MTDTPDDRPAASPCRRADRHDSHVHEVYRRPFFCPGLTESAETDAPPADDLRERIAQAARTVRLRLGTNAIALAQWGQPISLSGSEADALADAVLAVLPAPADRAAEVEELRVKNQRMRHELEVMYGGAFDEPKTGTADRAAVLREAAEQIRQPLTPEESRLLGRTWGHVPLQEILARRIDPQADEAPGGDR